MNAFLICFGILNAVSAAGNLVVRNYTIAAFNAVVAIFNFSLLGF